MLAPSVMDWPQAIDHGQSQLFELVEAHSAAMRLLVEDVCSRLKDGAKPQNHQEVNSPSPMLGKVTTCAATKPVIYVADDFDPSPPSPGAPGAPGPSPNCSMGSYPQGHDDGASPASSLSLASMDEQGLQQLAAMRQQNTEGREAERNDVQREVSKTGSSSLAVALNSKLCWQSLGNFESIPQPTSGPPGML
eukprot:s212_g10.t1